MTEVNETAQNLLHYKKKVKHKLDAQPQKMKTLNIKSIFNMIKVFGNKFLPLTYDFHCATTADERR